MTRSRMIVMGVALALTTFAMPRVPTHAADDMSAQIQSAKTAADHEAIAKDYDAQATSATQKAAMHHRMAESYKALARASGRDSGGLNDMPRHCESLAKGFNAEAEQYKAMAQTHRDLAKTLK